MLKQECRSLWKDKKLTLSIVVMFIIPLLYSGMLLWAFWNPYGHLNNLPVALVNNDEGYEFEGQQLALGNDLIINLNDNATFKFMETTSEEAQQMLANRDAYIVIEIPEHFSQHATTLLDDQPQKLELAYTVDESSNFLSSKIGDSAINQIRAEVNEEVAATYAEQLFEAITKLGDGYGEAAVGADELRAGVNEMMNGTTDLKGYLQQLASSTVTLVSGTEKLTEGVTAAKQGSAELVDGSSELVSGGQLLANGADELQVGAAELATGLADYSAGVVNAAAGSTELVASQQSLQQSLQQLTTDAESLADASNDVASNNAQLAQAIATLNSQLATVIEQLPDEQRQEIEQSMTSLTANSEQLVVATSALATNQTALAAGTVQAAAGQQQITSATSQLEEGLQQLAGTSASLTAGAKSVANGSLTLANSATDFNAGIVQLATGVSTLDQGLSELTAGSNELQTGTTTLNEKSHELANGSQQLIEGNERLLDGSTELTNALNDARNDSDIDVSEQNYEMVATPVIVDKTIENEVGNYGTGLAPYFISLGLFVGALLLTNVYPFVQPAIHPTSVKGWFISKSAVPFVVWIAQTAILSIFLLYGLKLEVTNVPLFIGLLAVTSFAFIAIVQLLTVVLGDVGRFVALVFLILQLAASAGTFPLELLPNALQSFHTYMPMSYSVEALRAVISSTQYTVVYSNMALLGTIGVICVVLSFAFFAILFKRRYSKKAEQV